MTSALHAGAASFTLQPFWIGIWTSPTAGLKTMTRTILAPPGSPIPVIYAAAQPRRVRYRGTPTGQVRLIRKRYDASTYLVLSFEYENIGHASERDTQVDDLGLGHLVRDVADVNHLRWLPVLVLVEFHLQQAINKSLSIKLPVG